MERVPEVECMGTVEEAEQYAHMDHEAANESFVDFLLEVGCSRGDLLDLGTGPGDIPLLLASKSAEANITATDLSEEMLRIARLKVAHAGKSQRIRLMTADAKQLPFADRHFDGVFSNTILHHVSDPSAFFREAGRVLEPTGALVIRDLARPASVEEVDKLVDRYAADANDYQKKLFYDSLRASYTVDEVRAFLDAAGLERAQVEMTSDRHLTAWIAAR